MVLLTSRNIYLGERIFLTYSLWAGNQSWWLIVQPTIRKYQKHFLINMRTAVSELSLEQKHIWFSWQNRTNEKNKLALRTDWLWLRGRDVYSGLWVLRHQRGHTCRRLCFHVTAYIPVLFITRWLKIWLLLIFEVVLAYFRILIKVRNA